MIYTDMQYAQSLIKNASRDFSTSLRSDELIWYARLDEVVKLITDNKVTIDFVALCLEEQNIQFALPYIKALLN